MRGIYAILLIYIFVRNLFTFSVTNFDVRINELKLQQNSWNYASLSTL